MSTGFAICGVQLKIAGTLIIRLVDFHVMATVLLFSIGRFSELQLVRNSSANQLKSYYHFI